jgi:hypothetical protein
MLTYLAVGHITVDRPVGGGVVQPGGSVAYAAKTATTLGASAAIVTRAATADVPCEQLADIAVFLRPSRVTTTFEQSYNQRGDRVQRLLSRAPSLASGDVPASWHTVDVLHIAPVIGEVDASSVARINAGFVGLTAQGWLRHAALDRHVHAIDPQQVPADLVRRADVVVVSEEDVAADPTWPKRIAEHLPMVVVTRGEAGAVAYYNGESVHQPAFPAKSLDTTGAGDVFAAALFYSMAYGATARAALNLASAAGACAVEGIGLAGVPTRAAILDRAFCR